MMDKNGRLNHVASPGCCGEDYTDLSRGAFYKGIIPETVFIDSSVLEEYAEIDPCLGRNLAGAVLDSLCVRLAQGPRLPLERMTMAAARRDDGAIVDLELRIDLVHVRGHACLVLEIAGEHEIADGSTIP
jgi:hypothetical protein